MLHTILINAFDEYRHDKREVVCNIFDASDQVGIAQSRH